MITKGFEFSRRMAICPVHGFQEEVEVKPVGQQRDVIMGAPMFYGLFCLVCGERCREEREVKED